MKPRLCRGFCVAGAEAQLRFGDSVAVCLWKSENLALHHEGAFAVVDEEVDPLRTGHHRADGKIDQVLDAVGHTVENIGSILDDHDAFDDSRLFGLLDVDLLSDQHSEAYGIAEVLGVLLNIHCIPYALKLTIHMPAWRLIWKLFAAGERRTSVSPIMNVMFLALFCGLSVQLMTTMPVFV